MAEQRKSPFDRVSHGYDPRQVAAFAADALTWKRDLARLLPELESALGLVQRYESAFGAIESMERQAADMVEDAERRSTTIIEESERRSAALIDEAERLATEIIERAENEAAEILEMAQALVVERSVPPGREPALEEHDQWIRHGPKNTETPDPVGETFERPDEHWPADETYDPSEGDQADRSVDAAESHDPVDEIFDLSDEHAPDDPDAERERRVAAATANLWKRRGVIAPPEG